MSEIKRYRFSTRNKRWSDAEHWCKDKDVAILETTNASLLILVDGLNKQSSTIIAERDRLYQDNVKLTLDNADLAKEIIIRNKKIEELKVENERLGKLYERTLAKLTDLQIEIEQKRIESPFKERIKNDLKKRFGDKCDW